PPHDGRRVHVDDRPAPTEKAGEQCEGDECREIYAFGLDARSIDPASCRPRTGSSDRIELDERKNGTLNLGTSESTATIAHEAMSDALLWYALVDCNNTDGARRVIRTDGTVKPEYPLIAATAALNGCARSRAQYGSIDHCLLPAGAGAGLQAPKRLSAAATAGQGARHRFPATSGTLRTADWKRQQGQAASLAPVQLERDDTEAQRHHYPHMGLRDRRLIHDEPTNAAISPYE